MRLQPNRLIALVALFAAMLATLTAAPREAEACNGTPSAQFLVSGQVLYPSPTPGGNPASITLQAWIVGREGEVIELGVDPSAMIDYSTGNYFINTDGICPTDTAGGETLHIVAIDAADSRYQGSVDVVLSNTFISQDIQLQDVGTCNDTPEDIFVTDIQPVNGTKSGCTADPNNDGNPVLNCVIDGGNQNVGVQVTAQATACVSPTAGTLTYTFRLDPIPGISHSPQTSGTFSESCLPNGTYTAHFQAAQSGGTRNTTATFTVVNGCDDEAPNTSIDPHSPTFTSSRVTIFFSGYDHGIVRSPGIDNIKHFRYTLTGPVNDTGTIPADSNLKTGAFDQFLSDGSYNLQLCAVDYSDNYFGDGSSTGGSCASTSFSVSQPPPCDTNPPNTSVTSGPGGTTDQTTVTFTFSGTDPEDGGSVTYETCLTSGLSVPCQAAGWKTKGSLTSSSYTNLSDGDYTFWVRAIDSCGNKDSSPASRGFTVDTLDPPCAPTNLAITEGAGAATVTVVWDPPPLFGANCGGTPTEYRVYRAPANNLASQSLIGTVPVGQPRAYIDGSLIECEYVYGISARIDSLEGDLSDWALYSSSLESCQDATCNHDGVVDAGEECDDNNLDPYDCCNNSCRINPDCVPAECPVVDAGSSRSFDPGTVALNATITADPDDGWTHTWTAVEPLPQAVMLVDTETLTPSFEARSAGPYVMRLDVTSSLDECLDSNPISDEITITIRDLPPIADAGADFTADRLSNPEVVLNGNGSADPNGDPLTYIWNAVPSQSPEAVTLSGADTATPSFTPTMEGTYTFSLLVSDGTAYSEPDLVVVTVIADGTNRVPVANAGFDRTYRVGELVQLDGSDSYDPDAGDTIEYYWSEAATNPANPVLDSVNKVNPSFLAQIPGFYQFNLVVIDNHGANSNPDTELSLVRITIVDEITCTVPAANAGPDQLAVQTGAKVDLTGSGESDCDITSYQWTQTEGPAVTLTPGNSAQNPWFNATQPGDYEFQLLVTVDNEGTALYSPPDSVRIVVSDVVPENKKPIADAGPNQEVVLPDGIGQVVIELDGTGSSDPDGDPLTYTWTQTSGTAVVLDPNINAAKPEFVASAGVYVFQLSVFDGKAHSLNSDTVKITILEDGQQPPEICVTPNTDRLYRVGDEVVLLVAECYGMPVTFYWTQVGGPAVYLDPEDLDGEIGFYPTAPGNYRIQVVAVADDGGFESDPVTFTFVVAANVPPQARINFNPNAQPVDMGTFEMGELVVLDGTGSFDNEDDPLTFNWVQEAGPMVEEIQPKLESPVIAFIVSETGEYRFSLQVNDGEDDSSRVSAHFTVEDSGGGGGGCGCAITADPGSALGTLLIVVIALSVLAWRRRPRSDRNRR